MKILTIINTLLLITLLSAQGYLFYSSEKKPNPNLPEFAELKSKISPLQEAVIVLMDDTKSLRKDNEKFKSAFSVVGSNMEVIKEVNITIGEALNDIQNKMPHALTDSELWRIMVDNKLNAIVKDVNYLATKSINEALKTKPIIDPIESRLDTIEREVRDISITLDSIKRTLIFRP